MKNTGIVRRIDDLGRIVIPREMRRTLKIGKNEPLEMFVDGSYLVLKKYDDFIDKDKLSNIASSLADSVNMPVAILSSSEVLASARISQSTLKDVEFPKHIDVIKPFIKNNVAGFNCAIYAPVVTEFGTNLMLVVFSKENKDFKEETILAELTAKIISSL